MRWFAKKQRDRGLWSLVCVMALVMIEGHASGQSELEKLLASDGVAGDIFGYSVSIGGDPGNEVAIIGAYAHADNGLLSGSAYIFRRSGSTWVEEAKLLAPDGVASDVFGWSVSISGPPGNEVVIVGAQGDDDTGTDSGSAYVFRKTGATWVFEQKLLASDGAASDTFGWSVSISGTLGNEVAVIGAYKHDDNGSNSGSAYIYRYDPALPGWTEEAKLLASDGAAGDFFGVSVSISGIPGNEIAIVGAGRDDDNGTDSGSAFIYRFNPGLPGWVEEQKLLASDGTAGDFFGGSVSISGNPGNEVIILGARGDDDNGLTSGSAYIYRSNGVSWLEEQKLLASDGSSNDGFGRSVSISGAPGNEVAIVGAYLDDDNGTNSGSAYIYSKSGANWGQEIKLLDPEGAATDFFGWSVAISGGVAIVGADLDDDNGIDSGSAFIITGFFIPGLSGDCNGNGINDLLDLFVNKSSDDCNDNGIPDECDIAFGASVDVNADGIPDQCLESCPPDTNSDGAVNVTDLLSLLAAWGVCP